MDGMSGGCAVGCYVGGLGSLVGVGVVVVLVIVIWGGVVNYRKIRLRWNWYKKRLGLIIPLAAFSTFDLRNDITPLFHGFLFIETII